MLVFQSGIILIKYQHFLWKYFKFCNNKSHFFLFLIDIWNFKLLFHLIYLLTTWYRLKSIQKVLNERILIFKNKFTGQLKIATTCDRSTTLRENVGIDLLAIHFTVITNTRADSSYCCIVVSNLCTQYVLS